MAVFRLLWVALLGLFLVLAGPSWAQDKSTSGRQFLHFGNMGGLMPDLKSADLPESGGQGARYLGIFCTQCHNMPGPGMRTQDEWSRIYWNMYWRIHMMNSQFKDFKVPDFGEGQELFHYLMRNALKAVKFSSVSMDEPGAPEYSRTCMQCHQLPDPAQHSADEWPQVVQRMKRHMRSMGKLVPSADEEQKIVGYLGRMSGN